MVENQVVKEVLSKEMIRAGAELTRLLDDSGLTVSASFWLFLPESNMWRLIIASQEVDEHGPRRVYEKIQSVLQGTHQKAKAITLAEISAVDSNDKWVSVLRKAIRTGHGVSGTRFSRNTIDGHFIEDAYIYRIT